MKKYRVFNLYVVTINKQKFICEPVIYGEEYREIFTKMKITLNDKFMVEILGDYYSVLERIAYSTGEPLMLSKEDILRKYLEINMPKIEDNYYQEQTDLSSIIDDIIEQPDVFYRMVGEQLTPEERQYIKSSLSKSCDTCSNGCCRVEQVDKPLYDCVDWENNVIIGQYKVLKLNRKIKKINNIKNI